MAYKDLEKKKATRLAYCQREDIKLLYQQAREKNKKRNQDYVRSLKEKTPCTDCGINYPYYVMDFDHIQDKIKNVGRLMKNSHNTLLKEIAKCEIVCSNCHRERTQKRLIGD
jgi:hypothetical protein